MSRYRGPRFKLIRRLGALPGLTTKVVRIRKKTTFRGETKTTIPLRN